MSISPAALFSQSSRVSHHNCMIMTQRPPSPSEEDNNVFVEPISLDKRHSIQCYVLYVVDPITQSTQLGIDLYIQALDLIRDRME